ncbi:hypothetical protein [Serratia ureilytica]
MAVLLLFVAPVVSKSLMHHPMMGGMAQTDAAMPHDLHGMAMPAAEHAGHHGMLGGDDFLRLLRAADPRAAAAVDIRPAAVADGAYRAPALRAAHRFSTPSAPYSAAKPARAARPTVFPYCLIMGNAVRIAADGLPARTV